MHYVHHEKTINRILGHMVLSRIKVIPFFSNSGDNNFLSNHHIEPFTHMGMEFKTLEHGFMYHKAMLFGDVEIAKRIIVPDTTPVEVKKLGRQVRNFDERTWNTNRVKIVRSLFHSKMESSESHREFFKENYNGDIIFVETNPYDRVWGIGLATNTPEHVLRDPRLWQGMNLMGYIVTEYNQIFRRTNR